jgi:hypothetical protein
MTRMTMRHALSAIFDRRLAEANNGLLKSSALYTLLCFDVLRSTVRQAARLTTNQKNGQGSKNV